MSIEKHNFLQLMMTHQWQTRVMIDSQPNTIIIKGIFTKDGEEFVAFEDQDKNQKTLRASLIDVPTFTME